MCEGFTEGMRMTQTDDGTPAPPLPYEEIGGPDAVRALVERFYDLMEADPLYAELRAMHDADLGPMRLSLTGFLSAWLGGPRDWFAANPGKCIMSAHRALNFGAQEARQWTDAMTRAMAETQVPAALAQQMREAFMRMAGAMRQR